MTNEEAQQVLSALSFSIAKKKVIKTNEEINLVLEAIDKAINVLREETKTSTPQVWITKMMEVK